jgi:hypothetical protein
MRLLFQRNIWFIENIVTQRKKRDLKNQAPLFMQYFSNSLSFYEKYWLSIRLKVIIQT